MIGATGYAVGICVTITHVHDVLHLCCQLEAAFEHRGRFILAVCTLTRHIAVKTPFSDFKRLQMDFFFYHWATLFWVFLFSFDCIENFSHGMDILPRKSKNKMRLRRQNISTPQ
jgi:hypothetical protein